MNTVVTVIDAANTTFLKDTESLKDIIKSKMADRMIQMYCPPT
ncbi:hypothetical protein FM109_07085 [Vibrio casei]|nr:hypothetical protein FM109_07085 [Vibrio casei]